MLRVALSLLLWAAVRCTGSAAAPAAAVRPSYAAEVEAADPEFLYKPGENILKRSTRGLGIGMLLQFFSYLPIDTTVDKPKEWEGTNKLEETQDYVRDVLWSKTSQGGPPYVDMHELAAIFNHPDVTAFVEHLGNKDYSEASATEHEFQHGALERMLREADKAESSGAPGFALAYLQGQEHKLDGTFAIFVDESAKRVVLAFRGSQGSIISGRDWHNNYQIYPGASLPINGKTARFEGTKITVHRGLRNFLFKQDKKTGRVLFDQIKEQLTRLDKGEYSLSVTGHSQGGGLATMAGYALAMDDTIVQWMAKDKPVEIFSYASPAVGWEPWRRAFQKAELGGALRHLRFMNDDDPVPTLRVRALNFANLQHCGARIILTSCGVESWMIDYPDVDNPNPKTKALYKTSLANHYTWEYLDRVKLAKKILHKFALPTMDEVFAELLKNHDPEQEEDNTYRLLEPN